MAAAPSSSSRRCARAIDALLITYRALSPSEDLRIEVLPTLRSGFVCRRGHPLARRLREAGALAFAELARFPLISTRVSDDVARRLVERYGSEASPQRWLQVSSEEIGVLVEAVRNTDAIFLGVLAVTRALRDGGELVELAGAAGRARCAVRLRHARGPHRGARAADRARLLHGAGAQGVGGRAGIAPRRRCQPGSAAKSTWCRAIRRSPSASRTRRCAGCVA